MDLRKYQLVFGLIVCILLQQSTSQSPISNELDTNLKRLSAGSESFAVDLFRRIARAVESVDYNFMISPFSIWTLLVMCSEGATGNTLKELLNTLQINQDFPSIRQGFNLIQRALIVNTSTVEVDELQAIFSNSARPLKDEYKNTLKSYYRTDILPVNFRESVAASNFINKYIERSTRGLIDFVVEEKDLQNADLALVSTIYFRAQWKYPFNKTLTKPEAFYDERGRQNAEVNMMYTKGAFQFTAVGKIDSHVLELPYGKEDRLVMLVFLPRKGTSLTSVIEKLGSYGIPNVIADLRKAELDYEVDEVEVFMPRFTTESDFQMNIILEQMGILDAFDPNKAKFTKMSDYPLFLTNIFHKTKIEVTEEGTVASAASAGTFANKSTPPRVYVNRPFAYIILEKTSNSLLFCGQVRKPTFF